MLRILKSFWTSGNDVEQSCSDFFAPSSIKNKNYRPELDGLRAVAVILVMLHHIGSPMFTGGYVGVDVFFVISGYLITSSILKDGSEFSLFKFYERRARRILPALYFTILLCTILSYFWMSQLQIDQFISNLRSVLFFIANWHFAEELSYFSPAVELNPLIHLWSLSVEEQFYLIYPIIFILLSLTNKSYSLIFVVIFFIISLWGLINQKISFEESSYFYTHLRAWELAVGCCAALILKKFNFSRFYGVSMLGFFLVLGPSVYFSSDTLYPSLYTALPVIGSFLVIVSCCSDSITGRLLSARPLVAIGMASFSVYLLHQPIFVFYRLRFITEPSFYDAFLLVTLSVLGGLFMLRYIEAPFRGEKVSRTVFIILMGFSTATLFYFSLAADRLGYISQISTLAEEDWRDESYCSITSAQQLNLIEQSVRQRCLTASRPVVLVGDSHAASLSSELRRILAEDGVGLVSLTSNGCFPIPQVSRRPLRQKCITDVASYWDFIQNTSATVIIATRWRLNLNGSRFDNGEGGVEYGASGQVYTLDADLGLDEHIVAFLTNVAAEQRVILINQIPEAGWDVPSYVARTLHFGLESERLLSSSFANYLAQNSNIILLLSELSRHENIQLVNPADLVCNTVYVDRCTFILEGQLLYRDDDHPTAAFAALISSEIKHLLSSND